MRIQIYILNLKRSPHRQKHMQEQLKNVPVPYTFIDATDGKGKSTNDFSKYNKNTLCITGKALSSTEIGAFYSHLSAMETAKKDGVDMAIIMEDDVIVSPIFADIIPILKKHMPPYDCIRLYTRNAEMAGNNNTTDISARTTFKNWGGALGYCITQNGIDKVLKSAVPIHMKIDNFLFGYWSHALKIAQFSKNLVGVTDDITSDIGYKNIAKIPRKPVRRIIYRIQYKIQALFNKIWQA